MKSHETFNYEQQIMMISSSKNDTLLDRYWNLNYSIFMLLSTRHIDLAAI